MFDSTQQDAVDNLIRVASNELSAAMVDNRLCLMVAGVFNACNADFLTKIEAHVKLGTDTVVVVGNFTYIFFWFLCPCVRVITSAIMKNNLCLSMKLSSS